MRFFNNIRQKLALENKVMAYLRYAIGEIVLVVIGILIALSVAEWNNTRHDISTEKRILTELHKDITNDLQALTEELEFINNKMVNLKELDSMLKFNAPEPNEKLYQLFGNVYGLAILNLNKATYEDLKSIGFGIISDQDLRSQIIKVYEDDFKLIDAIKENERSINQVIRPYYLTNFVSIRFHTFAFPKDLKKIWHDSYYHNVVNYRLVTLEFNQQNIYAKSMNDLRKLLKLLERNIN